jgi:hypothetical protein
MRRSIVLGGFLFFAGKKSLYLPPYILEIKQCAQYGRNYYLHEVTAAARVHV